MNCTSCGVENAEQAMFCTNCGAKLPGDAPETPAEAHISATAEQPPEESSPVTLETLEERLETFPEDEIDDAAYAPQKPAFGIAAQTGEKPVGVGMYFWLIFFGSLPVIGLIIHIILLSGAKRASLKNYSFAMLVWHIIFLVLTLVLIVLGFLFLDYINEILAEYSNIQIVPRF